MAMSSAASRPVNPLTDRPFPLVTGVVEVLAVERPTPRLARLTLGGSVLADLPDEEPGEIVTLIWPAPGRDDVVLPLEGWRFPPEAPEQHARNYTVRHYDRDRQAVVIDVVLHGDEAYASRWAGGVAPGAIVGFAGPRKHYVTMPDADWTLLVGDETALPSIAATIERLPTGHRVLAFVEVADALDHQRIESAADVELRWMHRDGEPAGTSRKLEQAIRAIELPPGRGKVWAAGEALAVRGLREHLRERGCAIGVSQALGYWKHRDTPDEVE